MIKPSYFFVKSHCKIYSKCMIASNSAMQLRPLFIMLPQIIIIPQIRNTRLLYSMFPPFIFYITRVSPYLNFHIMLNQPDIIFGRDYVLVCFILFNPIKLCWSVVLAILKSYRSIHSHLIVNFIPL